MSLSRGRRLAADLLGLGFILFVLLDYLRPSFLLLPTIAAGGDTPCHYPSAEFFAHVLLPRLRVHGWYAGAYLGHPLFLYYFPFPFLVMAGLAPLLGMPVAFKLGIALPVFLFPLLAYGAFRLMGFSFPVPLVGAASALVFLFVEENPIWGGTIASTLTGEFCYTWGAGAALLFLGVAYRSYSRNGGVILPGVLLALTAVSHGYALLWAGLSATFFLYGSRRPLWTLGWLARVALLAFALVGPWIVPLLASWRFTTPYDDPWISVTPINLAPPLLWPLFALALLGLLWAAVFGRRSGGFDRRLLFLLHAGLVGAALATLAPALGVIDVRLVPLAQLAFALLGGAILGLAVSSLATCDLAALALVVLLGLASDVRSHNLRPWIDWNFQGLEAKELWPQFEALCRSLKGKVGDPRVAVEYHKEHERAGSIRMYETLPFFSGRSTLEGVYNQASLQTHEVYYLASELGETSPNPFKSRDYAHFDIDAALPHLRLFNVGEIVALSPRLIEALRKRPEVEEGPQIPPYAVFRLKDPGPGYVEPVAFQPFRTSPRGFRDKAFFAFTRKPLSPVPLVFTDDPRFPLVPDEVLPPPRQPLPEPVVVHSTLSPESLEIETSRIGHPLLVKVSYHPRWRAEGADGPYLVSPALMLIVPRESRVRLVYGRDRSDALGLFLAACGLGAIVLAPFVRGTSLRRAAPQAPSPALLALAGCGAPPPPRRWGGVIPGGLLLLCVLGRLKAPPDRKPEAEALRDKAKAATASGRPAAAEEYARAALALRPQGTLRLELLCLRGEGLLPDEPAVAAAAFSEVTREAPPNPWLPEALFGAFEAGEASGDLATAGIARERLLRGFPGSPWTEKLKKRLAETAGSTPAPSRPSS
jgi:hypothetical protein